MTSRNTSVNLSFQMVKIKGFRKGFTIKTISDATLLYSAACVWLFHIEEQRAAVANHHTGEVGGTCRDGFPAMRA